MKKELTDIERLELIRKYGAKIFKDLHGQLDALESEYDLSLSYHLSIEITIGMMAFILYLNKILMINDEKVIEIILNKALERSKNDRISIDNHDIPDTIQ